jgi:diadenosine tetraphosphatase ApaH/serine/threonine PP2A family protein phosphatase
MVNPGSVGQPRDGDPRAAYAIYDTEQKIVRLRRVSYPIQQTADDIRKAGLPSVLAIRLFRGM